MRNQIEGFSVNLSNAHMTRVEEEDDVQAFESSSSGFQPDHYWDSDRSVSMGEKNRIERSVELKRDRLRHAISASIILIEEFIPPETAKKIDELVETVINA